MIFRSKYDKQIQNIQEKNKGRERAYDRDDMHNVMEKGDLPAMIISAMLVILPVALVVLLIVSAAGYFFVAR